MITPNSARATPPHRARNLRVSSAQATALLGVAAMTAAGVIGTVAGLILIVAAYVAVRAAMSL